MDWGLTIRADTGVPCTSLTELRRPIHAEDESAPKSTFHPQACPAAMLEPQYTLEQPVAEALLSKAAGAHQCLREDSPFQ